MTAGQIILTETPIAKGDGSFTAVGNPITGAIKTEVAGGATAEQIGAINETAPATDTASSGLNGRLQRIAQRITSLITLLPDAKTAGGSFKAAIVEALTAGENFIGKVGGTAIKVDVPFVRGTSTTPYTANTVMASDTSSIIAISNIFRVAGGSGYLASLKLSTNKKSITPRFRVHLFNANTVTLATDNASYKELYADASKRVKYFDLPAMATSADTTNSDMSRAILDNINSLVVAASGSRDLFFALEPLDAFTPASGQSFTLSVYMDNN